MKIKMLWPVRSTEVGDVSTGRWYTGAHNAGMHSGIDVYVNGIDIRGYDVLAAKDGKVVKILSGCKSYNALKGGERCQAGRCENEVKNGYCNDTVGNMVILEHEVKKEDGSTKYLYSQYCHLEEICVSLNQVVNDGDKIGTVGSTGESSAPHLHFSISTGYAFWGRDRINNNPCNIDVSGITYGTDGYEFEYFDSTIKLFMNRTLDDNSLFQDNWGYAKRSDHEIISPENSTNQRFLGWYTARSGGTKVTKYSDIPAGTKTLYAIWEVKTMSVTYNYGLSGVENVKDTNVKFGNKYGTKVPDANKTKELFSKNGYDFNGWYYGAITKNSVVNMEADHTLNAIKAPKTLTVSFDPGSECGFAEEMKPILVKYGETYGGLPVPRSDKLYKFSHWEIIDGNDKNLGACASDTKVAQKADHTLRAVWEKDRAVTFVFPENGSLKTYRKAFGEKYGLAPKKELDSENEGYIIKWYFDAPGSQYNGMEYFPGMLVHPDHPNTVKGEYERIAMTFTVDFGSDFVNLVEDESHAEFYSPTEVKYGDTYQLPNDPVCTENYEFMYWEIVNEYGESLGTVESGDTVTAMEDHTIVAVWSNATTVLLFDDIYANECIDSFINVKYGSTYHFLPDMEKEGYDFNGWYFIGGSQAYHNKRCYKTDRVIPGNPYRLYPVFTPKKVNVMYEPCGGEYMTEPADTTYDGIAIAEIDYDSSYTFPAVTMEDKEFLGWYYDEKCTEQCCEGDTVSNPEPHTLYADWGKAVTLSFVTGDGATVHEPVTIYTDHVYGELPVPTKDGYVFAGWFYDEGCTDNCYSTDVVTNPSAHTIYAGWAEKLVTVTFDAGSYANDCGTKSVGVGLPYGELPVPVSTKHHIFRNWMISEDHEDFGGTVIYSDYIVEMDTDHTLVAEWETARMLNLDTNGGTMANNRRSVHYGENYPYITIPVRDGYTFGGWFFRGGEYDGLEVTMDLIVLPEHPDTAVAEWIPVSEE